MKTYVHSMKRMLCLAILLLAACGGTESAEPKATDAIRAMALSAKVPIQAAPGEVMLVVADMDLMVTRTTLVVTKDGDASLYNKDGGAIIGGGDHPHIRTAAMKLVSQAAAYKDKMSVATSFPYPGGGDVRFYVRTPERVYTTEAALADLMDEKHPFAALFGAVMDVARPLQDLGEKTK